ACMAKGERLRDQRIVFAGAGSAGCGIAEQLIAQMRDEGLTDAEARQRIFLLNRSGLVTSSTPELLSFQQVLSGPDELLQDWQRAEHNTSGAFDLLDVVNNVRPTVLVGVSAQAGLFTQKIIQNMQRHCERPIVLPLSNPTSKVEGFPADILRWTD